MPYPALIKITRQGNRAITIDIDGHTFTADAAETTIDRTDPPGVVLSLTAERVEIIDDSANFRPA